MFAARKLRPEDHGLKIVLRLILHWTNHFRGWVTLHVSGAFPDMNSDGHVHTDFVKQTDHRFEQTVGNGLLGKR